MPIQKDVQTLIINKMSKERYEREYAAGNIADDEIVLIPDEDSSTTYENATTSSDGLMSKEDKTKLDGIEAGANNYTHPTTSGNKHIPTGGSEGKILKWKSDGEAEWADETDTNTTYENATTSSDGLMSSTDKTKLDGIEEGANNYVHPDVEHLPGGGSDGQILKRTADGSASWGTLDASDVNADEAGSADKALTSAEEYTDLAVALKSSVHIHDSEGAPVNLSNLKLYPISKSEYEAGLANNTLEQNAMYLIPDNGGDSPVVDNDDKLNIVIETTDAGKVYNIVNDAGTVIASIDDNGINTPDVTVSIDGSPISVRDSLDNIEGSLSDIYGRTINGKSLNRDIELSASDIKTSSDNTVQYVLTNHANLINNNEGRFLPEKSVTTKINADGGDNTKTLIDILKLSSLDGTTSIGNWAGIISITVNSALVGTYLVTVNSGANTETDVPTCNFDVISYGTIGVNVIFSVYGNNKNIIIELRYADRKDGSNFYYDGDTVSMICRYSTISVHDNCTLEYASTIGSYTTSKSTDTKYTKVNNNSVASNLINEFDYSGKNASNNNSIELLYKLSKGAICDDHNNIIRETYFSQNYGPIKYGSNTTRAIMNNPENTVTADYATAMGSGTISNDIGELVCGQFNKSRGNNSFVRSFCIGNGTSNAASDRSNAATIHNNGNMFLAGEFSASGSDYAEYFEWEDSNPNNEDRRGYFVTMSGEKIRIATSADYILGVITGHPSVVGNGDIDWMGRYLTDEFGSRITETYEYYHTIEEDVTNEETGEVTTITKIVKRIGTKYKQNPDYDPTRKYIQRRDRPEWAAVGMMGVLHVRDDGTCKVNGFCTVTDNGTATASNSGYRVIARTSENIIKVILK